VAHRRGARSRRLRGLEAPLVRPRARARLCRRQVHREPHRRLSRRACRGRRAALRFGYALHVRRRRPAARRLERRARALVSAVQGGRSLRRARAHHALRVARRQRLLPDDRRAAARAGSRSARDSRRDHAHRRPPQAVDLRHRLLHDTGPRFTSAAPTGGSTSAATSLA
jgi:hypothetical protein